MGQDAEGEVGLGRRALLLRGGPAMGAAVGWRDWLLVCTVTSSQATVMGGPVVGRNDGISPAGDGLGGMATGAAEGRMVGAVGSSLGGGTGMGAVVGLSSGSVRGVLDGTAGRPGLGSSAGAVV